jgi:hypothetical protein
MILGAIADGKETTMGTDSNQLQSDIDLARSRLDDSVEGFGYSDEFPDEFSSRVKELLTDQVAAMKGAVSDAASAISAKVPRPDDIRAGADRIGRMVIENPVGMALGAVAVGFLVGLILPRTSLETERIVPLAQDVKRLARDAGTQAVNRGKQIVWEAAQAAVQATFRKS